MKADIYHKVLVRLS